MSLIKSWLKTAFLFLVSLAIPVILLEIALGYSGIVATSANTLPVTRSNPIITHTPNTSYRWARGAFGEISHIKTVNNFGFVSHRDFDPDAEIETVALVGGSWVLANEVPMQESIGFQLDEALSADVYPVSASQPNLAQNLGFVEFAIDVLRADKVVVVLANDHLSDALTDRHAGKRIFDKAGDLTLSADFVPSLAYRLVTSTSIANYLFKNIQIQRFLSPATADTGADARQDTAGQAPQPDPENDRQTDTAIRFFVEGLLRTGHDRSDMLFVFAPEFGSVEQGAPRSATSKFHKLAAALEARGFATYDLQDAFVEDFRKNGQTFTIPNDPHWNGYGQGLAARLIAAHPLLAPADSTVNQ